ncbi:MAG: hypothetical protein QM571_00020 [Micrococcaceae bacterium]
MKSLIVTSQAVADYVQYIPKIEEDLADEEKALDFYKNLAPGYRKD